MRRMPHPDIDWGGIRVPPSLPGAMLRGRCAPKPVVQLFIYKSAGYAGIIQSLDSKLGYATIVTRSRQHKAAVQNENKRVVTMNKSLIRYDLYRLHNANSTLLFKRPAEGHATND